MILTFDGRGLRERALSNIRDELQNLIIKNWYCRSLNYCKIKFHLMSLISDTNINNSYDHI